MDTLPQGTDLIAVGNFGLKPPKGRTIQVKVGDKFMVTNSQTSQISTGFCQIARSGKAKIGQGHYMAIKDINLLFKINK